MKLQGQITILVNPDETIIEIRDPNASITFAKVKLTAKQFSAALGRSAYIDCELDVYALDKIGKKHENKIFEYEIHKELSSSDKKDELHEIALKLMQDGWTPDKYFGAQNSFFKKDGKHYARTTIRRWI